MIERIANISRSILGMEIKQLQEGKYSHDALLPPQSEWKEPLGKVQHGSECYFPVHVLLETEQSRI